MKDDNNVVLDSMTIRLMKTYHPERLEALQAEAAEAKEKIKKALKSTDSAVSNLVEGYTVADIVKLSKSFDLDLDKAALFEILERNLVRKE